MMFDRKRPTGSDRQLWRGYQHIKRGGDEVRIELYSLHPEISQVKIEAKCEVIVKLIKPALLSDR